MISRTCKRRLGALAAVLLLGALAACGGGGSVAMTGVGTGGTGISLGTVTGFGSVVIEGHGYDGAAPHYFNDDDPGVGQAATSVGLGQRLQLITDSSGSAALIEPDVVGPLQSVSAASGSFMVNGLLVRVNTDPSAGPVTFYSGLSGFSALSPGSMVIEADGSFGVDASGQPYLQATRVVQLPPATQAVRLTGVVSGLNAAGTSFDLGAIHVQLDSATQVYPAGSKLADGQLVNAWSAAPIDAGVLSAGVVRVRSLLGASGAARLGGLLTRDTAGTTRVAGIVVTPADGSVATALQAVGAGQYVIVQGRIAPDGSSVLATSVVPYASQPALVELRGNITGYVDDAHFLVRGVPVNASAVAAGARLGNGVFVDITGAVDPTAPNTVRASSLQVDAAAPSGGTVDLTGTVTQYDAGSGTFLLSWTDDGVTTASAVTLLRNAVLSGPGGNGALPSLANGSYVEVEATSTPSGLQAYSLRFLPGSDDASASRTSGRVYALDATGFYVNGLRIQINGVAVQGGTLADGDDVEVQFNTDPATGQNLASAIGIDD